MRVIAILLAGFAFAAPLAAQNNGLPNRQQSAVLMELITQRGEECELLRPWQAASLRMQTRDLIESLDEETRAVVAAEVETRLPEMECEDSLLNAWIEGAGPGFEREYLPELLTAYRAFAEQDPPPAPFSDIAAREDYAEALALIDAKLGELEAAGVVPPTGGWDTLAERQTSMAGQIAGAIAGTGETTRFSAEEATRLAEDVARIGELWLADRP